MEMVHGGDVYSAAKVYDREIIDFSANINPLGMPQAVRLAAVSAVSDCIHYPDPLCRTLRLAISHTDQIPSDWIICGNGAADLIFRIVLSIKPKCALVLAPCFAEYEQALSAVNCNTKHYPLSEINDFCLDELFLEKLTDNLDMLFLCNPNNPTGQIISPELIKQILKKCKEKNIFLLMDECFLDFLEEGKTISLKSCLADSSNLFILKAFTKMYAMPGLRLGYGLCSNKDLLMGLSACGQPWSVSVPAQSAGIAALQERNFVQKTRSFIAQEREYLTRELSHQGIQVFPSYANYILFKTKSIFSLKEQLLQKGILIRSCANYRRLDEHFYRIAVRCHADNEKLIFEIQKIIKGVN